MLRSLFSGISGLKVHQVRLDVVSNNIANVNTTGFKASRVRFDDVMSQTIEIATAPESGRGGQNPKQIGLGVLGTTITRNMEQGAIEITNETTNLAIQGGGFFILRDGENIGEYYSRDGNFTVDSNGDLVLASNGFRVQGWNAFLDTKTNTMTINSSNPVEDIHINMDQQMAPIATTQVNMSGNLDSRLSTAIDPVRVSWTKNGTTREVEFRFTHVDPTQELYLWEVYDPNTIDPTTGDFQKITTDFTGGDASGIVKIDENGKVIANYINTADDDASDPATNFLSSTEIPDDSKLWALNNSTRTFNGYDFITLDTNGDGDAIQQETNSRLTSQTTATNALDPNVNDVTITVPNAPLSSNPKVGGDYPNGFTQDAVFQTGTPWQGNSALPGDGLGVPVQYIESVTNEVVSRISADRTKLQLAHPNIIDSKRANPASDGKMSSTNGTDADSLKLFIDGVQYTRIDNTQAFTAGATEFKLDPDNGVITLGSALANGVNAIVSYDYEIRPTNTRSIPGGRTIGAEFGASAVGGGGGGLVFGAPGGGTQTSSADGSMFYVPGSATLTVTDTSASKTETFTEVPFDATKVAGWGTATDRNTFMINPQDGTLYIGDFSDGTAIDAANDTISGSYDTFRRFGGETQVTVASGTSATAIDAAFPNGYGGGAPRQPYVLNSVGTLTIIHNSGTGGGAAEIFTEVPPGTTLGARQFSIDPATNTISFGNFFNGEPVLAADTLSGNATFDFYNVEIDVDGDTNADNVLGQNDLWRVLEIPNGGAETGNLNLWLQGDGLNGATPNRPSDTSLKYLPNIGTTYPERRAELNYESDDRVNIIIPNGLTKNPNVDPLVDKTPETFAIAPNVTQITGNNGNNNQADSGDSQTVAFNVPEDYTFATAIEVYDSLGTPWNVPLKFERMSTNLWIMYAIDPTDPDGQRIAFKRLIAFDANGNFDSASTIPYEAPTANGTANDGFQGIYFDPSQAGGAAPPEEGADPVTINLDFTDLVQTARKSDAVVASQNGAPPGRLETFSFNDEGFLVGLFDNGQSMNLARVALQGFVNPAGLVAVGSNLYKDTVNAGKFGSPQRPGFDGVGTIVPGALENSNVDLSVEFVDLIITQRGFQAQSRSITTSDQVLQEILTLKR
ncbi:MAG: flagellar hook-basal body complex protein [Candidatus Hydrogenedentota bacterium]|nr:MAG: flagellar hook-basal body complex protein [Candidatus Hydrogenedentota bacterium]